MWTQVVYLLKQGKASYVQQLYNNIDFIFFAQCNISDDWLYALQAKLQILQNFKIVHEFNLSSPVHNLKGPDKDTWNYSQM